MEHEKITITITVFDEDGEMTGEKKEVELSTDQIADIIDHAIQVNIFHENGYMDTEKEDAINELGEALSAAELIE